jgi:hypothetical protein
MKRISSLLLLALVACSGPGSGAPPVDAAAPAWARLGDREDAQGHHFVCQGEGGTDTDALAAAHGICNDKICKLCGVEVESIVQTTETLTGVEMQRRVVERCRRFRKAEPKVLYKSSDCGPGRCLTWLEVLFTAEDEARECAAYAAEHFADPEECQRLIEEFRRTPERTAESFRARTRVLDAALSACADIDVRPTPLVESLHQKLFAGMDDFEFTPAKQQEELERPFFEGTWYKSREDMMKQRSVANWYLTTDESLRQTLRETPTLLDRIRKIRDYVANRALVFDVIEAAQARDLDSAGGVARLCAALRAAPPGAQYGSPDVHLATVRALERLDADTSCGRRFFREQYDPRTLYWDDGIPLAHLFGSDGLVDAEEWAYIVALHEAHDCAACVRTLLEVKNHGAPGLREERAFAAVNANLARATRPEDRPHKVREVLPSEWELRTNLFKRLPPELRDQLR